ncbi:MAG: hypothetical protein IKM23_02565 [Bacteroidales bacterium]|nr:hypothetical protein [Bacteroidales bacterium]
MKALKKISMAMIAVLMSVSFVACNPDDNSTEDLKGRWYTKTESVNNLLIINDDNSVVSFKVSNYESWENVKGNLTVDGNEISIYFEDGNSLSGTCTVTDNILTINTNNGEYKYSRLADETNLVGDWNYSNITFSAKAIKDEIVIPGGTINGVEVPPTVMQTAQLSGEFIEFAAQRYFRNIKFNNDGTMAYNVLKDEGDLSLTKDYSIDGLNMTVSGETAGHAIASTFMVLQSYDNNTAYFIFNKENIAEMFIGYALMLFEGGIAPDVTDEALNAYKKAFTEAFDYYRVEFIINRAK